MTAGESTFGMPGDPSLLNSELDVLIVGGGPAGTAAAFRCREVGLRFLVIDFDDVLKRIRDYPKDKLILPDFGGGDRMAFPAGGDCIGSLQFAPIDKDDMCATWKSLYNRYSVPVAVGIEMTGLEATATGWKAATWNHRTREPGALHARHVVLALGRGVPRRFDIPGNTDGVAYRLDDPVNYAKGPVCVIGGGTSSAEAVIAISKAKVEVGDDSQVFWSYRGSKMPRVSKALADEFFEAYMGNGNIRYRPNSEPVAVITAPDRSEYLSIRVDRRTGEHRPPETVHLEFSKTSCIACIGEDIPESFLREIGVHMFTGGPHAKKMCAVTPLLETQQRNVYLIGDLLSQAYLETDDFGAPVETFRQVKHRGNIKTSLRDGVFIAEVIKQRLEGRQRVDVQILDAAPQGEPVTDAGIARVTAALGLSPATQAIAVDSLMPQESREEAGWLVSLTPTGIEAEQFALKSSGAVTIGRIGCDITFPNDLSLSDSHASISCRDGEYYLRDDGSRSGTYLRVRPESPVPVLPGALLRVGRQILVIGRDQAGFQFTQYDTAGREIQRHALQTGALVLGRRAGPSHPDIALDDADMTLSRFHVSLMVQGAVVVVQDFGSRNGTYLKIDGEARIEHEDIFRVGAQQLQLKLREDLPEKTDSYPVLGGSRTAAPAAAAAPPAVAAAPPPVSAPAVAAAAPQAAPAPAPAGSAHLTFQDQGISGDADPSETMLEWADARDVDIDNECWIGMCGCDVVRIVQGAEHLSEIGDKELKTLKRKGLEPGPYRLACMARCSGPVVVEVAS
jgi:thioredoxin reductase/pSer/pThr/pTyr-binding forkhead associated (FHA) protein/ferredoxin